MPRRPRLNSVLGLGCFGLCLAIAVFWIRSNRGEQSPAPFKMLFTYPITYLEPALYDDWETVFVGNHIYARLLSEKDKPSIPFLAEEIDVACAEPAGPNVSSSCRRVRVSFAPKSFTDCAGRSYGTADIQKEFEILLAAKSWVMPGWRRCADGKGTVCVTGKNTGDIQRRLKNVNFRFGWSKRRKDDGLAGTGPYCLKATFNAKKQIEAGVLELRDANARLPRVEFAVGGGRDSQFDVALYGTKDLLKGTRKNVQAHTPLAYYVITNPSLVRYQLPWNTAETRRMINEHFVREEVFFPQASGVEGLVPAGNALGKDGNTPAPHALPEFALPDYLPGCRELAAKLTDSWSGRAKASCANIVTYVQGNVREKRGTWSAFLVGLSPADPGRDSLKLQYFSTDSPDSLTYDYPDSEALFYLAGIGQSLVTVDGEKVCDLKPNVLGLGDIFATDFVRCVR